VIRVRGLRKVYRVPERGDGSVRAAIGSLFRRQFREVRAVDGIDFDIAPGERVGFLGPNGAGKTTTLKMLCGLLVPTAGEIEVLGQVPRRRPVELLRQITLVMGQKQQLLWDLPPRDTFELNRALFRIPKPEYDETVSELTRLLELGPLLSRPSRNLSLGERMKCELAAALLHRPRVLFLDEPTIGLDVVAQGTMRRFIAEWNERFESTVLLTSHYMDDIAALCPRVIIIDKGTLLYDGSLDGLVRRVRPHRRIELRPASPPAAGAIEAVPGLAWEDDVLVADVEPAHVGDTLQAALGAVGPAEVRVVEPPLEDVIAELFRSGRADGG
jgi:ABC-2 type transport system ATP-binding protein